MCSALSTFAKLLLSRPNTQISSLRIPMLTWRMPNQWQKTSAGLRTWNAKINPLQSRLMTSSYRQLDAARIVETIALLQRRIEERFPSAGLCNVIAELKKVGEESVGRAEWARRPNIPVRI